MKKSIFLFTLACGFMFVVWLALPEISLAQAPPTLPTKPVQNPIDGGLALLAAGGGGYAIKKLWDRKK